MTATSLGPDFRVDISSSSSQLTHFTREVVLAGHLQALADMIDTEIDQQMDQHSMGAYSIAHPAACDGEDLKVCGCSSRAGGNVGRYLDGASASLCSRRL